MSTQTYLIALGGNQRTRHGSPEATLRAAIDGFPSDIRLVALSRVIRSCPIGPSLRAYANAAAVIETDLFPPALLGALKAIERAFGRRSGRRWGARPLDLDIIGWSGGIWASPRLGIPHRAFRDRAFVLTPLTEIAPDWSDPVTHLTSRQLRARLDRKRPRA